MEKLVILNQKNLAIMPVSVSLSIKILAIQCKCTVVLPTYIKILSTQYMVSMYCVFFEYRYTVYMYGVNVL